MGPKRKHTTAPPPSTPKALKAGCKPPVPGQRRCKRCHSWGCKGYQTKSCVECTNWKGCPTFNQSKHKAEAEQDYQVQVSIINNFFSRQCLIL